MLLYYKLKKTFRIAKNKVILYISTKLLSRLFQVFMNSVIFFCIKFILRGNQMTLLIDLLIRKQVK